mmetsp:Transcript_13272/g.57788  ORF Transcript_13272/g.57788 Transcript_13272/m.57788 type:complete len:133 (+) Transcript_13272:24-422(+)
MSDRYKSRGRKERTPEQLKVLEMAREKARLVIAERTKIKREMEEPEPAEPEETEPPTPPPEPPAELPAEDSAPEPPAEPSVPAELPAEVSAPPPQPSLSREEIQTLIHSTLDQRRQPERKYQYINGAYVKIK